MKDFHPISRNFFKTRTIDITFTVILGMFTCIFGYYVFTAIRNVKAAKAKKTSMALTIPHHKTIHHKIKHRLKKFAKILQPGISVIDTTEVLSSQKASANPPIIYADKNSMASSTIANNSLTERKPENDIPISNTKATNGANLPYTTYLKANETGVINMRKFDNYGSDIIKIIPTNSSVAVLQKGNIYYKVIFENTTGYVAKWNVLKK